MAIYRGVNVPKATVALVKKLGLPTKGGLTEAEVQRRVAVQPNFPEFYKGVAALYGECPEGVDALSRMILGIADPAFRNGNLVETHFEGAVRGKANPNGRITADDITSQQARMDEARDEFLGFATDRRIAWPATPFEDATGIEEFSPTDESDVIAHGRAIWRRFGGRVLALGVGGSSNGSRVITGAFQLEKAAHAGFTFASDHLRATLDKFFTGRKVGHIIVASLSGTTMETLTNLLAAIEKLQEMGISPEQYKDYITVLTGGANSKLREIAEKYGLKVFYCKPNEGGRFSIWTVIGTLWAEANGVDSLEAKAGAMLAQYGINSSDLAINPA
ncbi:MAG: hypothetical protein NT099_05965, partial [Candidatus Saganbacteria bacterium]|nr:hypothetical protein [Candidatus Saganbacteria bacterium]